MKRITALILLTFLTITVARADTPLTISYFSNIPCCGGPCWDDELPLTAQNATGTFTLTNETGSGKLLSGTITAVDNSHGQSHILYTYSVDMSALPASQSHCIKLLVHFGSPLSCASPVLVYTDSGGVMATSASKAPFGDVTFTFGSGCMTPGTVSDPIRMLSDVGPKNGFVTIIDDYTSPSSGLTNEFRIQVPALVPDIPPNWAYVPPYLPNVLFQGNLDLVGTNQYSTNVPITAASNGLYDFTLQLVDAASNGLPIGPSVIQSAQITGGLFNLQMPFDLSSYTGPTTTWLSMGVRPSGQGQFTQLLPAVQVSPTAQAFYAYSAGVVADISPDQAVLSINGINGNLNVQGGQGIQVSLNGDGHTLLISQTGAPSDRNIKTDFTDIQPNAILAKLAALPIQSWRYTNEPPGIRHIGPMAQDFQAAFGLGSDNKTIGNVDEGGIALTAIQALNQQLEKRDAQIKALEQRLRKLEDDLAERDKSAP